jgi:hypothetical protein
VDTTAPQTGGYLQILLLLAFLIPAILFLVSQQNILKAINPENRLMNPGFVWLQLIPIFGQVWQFIVVTRIADSIKKEIGAGQDDSVLGFSDISSVEEHNERPTYMIGIAYCSFSTAALFFNILFRSKASSIPLIAMVISFSFLIGMICWIVYWVRLAKYTRKLKRAAGF